MRERTLILMTLLLCGTILLAVFLYDEAHRYDVVAAGSGGSNEQQGDIQAFLVDHKTGQMWMQVADEAALVPMVRETSTQPSSPNRPK
jgi:hypothetical protein